MRLGPMLEGAAGVVEAPASDRKLEGRLRTTRREVQVRSVQVAWEARGWPRVPVLATPVALVLRALIGVAAQVPLVHQALL